MKAISFLGAAAAGAAAAYFLDPENGRVRRALARERCRTAYAQLRRRAQARAGGAGEPRQEVLEVATVLEAHDRST